MPQALGLILDACGPPWRRRIKLNTCPVKKGFIFSPISRARVHTGRMHGSVSSGVDKRWMAKGGVVQILRKRPGWIKVPKLVDNGNVSVMVFFHLWHKFWISRWSYIQSFFLQQAPCCPWTMRSLLEAATLVCSHHTMNPGATLQVGISYP